MDSIVLFMSTLQISEIDQCAVHLAGNEFSGETLILYQEHTDSVIAQQFAKIVARPVFVYTTDWIFYYQGKPDVVPAKNIIWIPKLKDFDKQIENVRNNVWWKSSSKLLIIMNEESRLNEIFEELWRKSRSSNVVVINENLEIYTWMPYQKSTCNENITPVLLSTCAEIKHPVFFNKIPNDMNNCPFYVTTQQVWPYVGAVSETIPAKDGLEIVIINTISQKLKLNLTYVLIPPEEPFYSHINENVLSGAPGRLFKYETDIVFASYFQTSQPLGYAELINVPHTNDKLVWFIPQPQEVPAYKNLYLAFEFDCWIAILSVTVLIISTEWLLRKFVEKDKPEIILQFLFALSVNLNIGVPMPKSKLLKAFMMICFVYGLHVIIAYESSLISFLTRPVMDEPVKSVKEGMEKGMTAYLYEPHRAYIVQPGFPDREDILTPGKYVFREQMHFEQMKTFQDKMILGMKTTTLFYLTWLKIIDKDGQLLVRIMDQDVMSVFVTMIIVRGHPLKPKIDLAVQQIIETGLREKWMADVMSKNPKVSVDLFSDQISLTFDSLIGAFYILAIGLLLGFLSFSIEMIKNRHSRLPTGKRGFHRKARTIVHQTAWTLQHQTRN